jgi:uncharacterized peroxidase-related enzyme
MSRLPIPTRDEAPAASQPILDAVGAQLGLIPNLYKVVALSPKALEAFTGFGAGVAKLLDLKTRERIALATAQVNGCDYCLSAHTYIGANMAKLDESEIALARTGHSADAKADAAVTFAKKVADTRGQVSDADIAAVKLAGFTDAQVVEIVLVVIENFLTNFVNNVAQTAIDFPEVRAKAA